ncbi:hypothetical protein [Weissella paramesenteroides]|uniref:hypothetical protein n=1 Tax=Weissella paramesenteroides TaxID=1249 RepID=UPI003981B64A
MSIRYSQDFKDSLVKLHHYNFCLAMNLLNQSSETRTLTYLGLDQASREMMLDQIDFG